MNIALYRSALAELRELIALIESDEGEYLPDMPFSREGIGTCTVTAIWLAQRLRGQLGGYDITNNPTAELGQLEGGHDFCLVGGRFIVDWWATEYAAVEPQHPGVLDLGDPAQAQLALRWYGDRNCWTIRTP